MPKSPSNWWTRLGNRLINPDVIDASRSWFANFSGIAATMIGFVICLMMYYGAWSAETEKERITFFFWALMMTQVEAIICLFYLHRLGLEALKLKAGAVEVEVETNGPDPQVQQTVRTKAVGSASEIIASGTPGTPTDEAGLLGTGGQADAGSTTTVVRTRPDSAG